MENGPFIDDFPIETSIYKGFSMAMLNNQMVIHDMHIVIMLVFMYEEYGIHSSVLIFTQTGPLFFQNLKQSCFSLTNLSRTSRKNLPNAGEVAGDFSFS